MEAGGFDVGVLHRVGEGGGGCRNPMRPAAALGGEHGGGFGGSREDSVNGVVERSHGWIEDGGLEEQLDPARGGWGAAAGCEGSQE
jgi:hypothetical protein